MSAAISKIAPSANHLPGQNPNSRVLRRTCSAKSSLTGRGPLQPPFGEGRVSKYVCTLLGPSGRGTLVLRIERGLGSGGDDACQIY